MPAKSKKKKPAKRDPTVDKHTGESLSLTPKQIRARARRRQKRYGGARGDLHPREVELLLRKPIEEWDEEELARGRPRSKDGSFRGAPPTYITRELQERAFEVFAGRVKEGTQALSISALEIIGRILDDEETMRGGRPVVPASVKLDAAKYLIDRVLGKPTQPIKGELDVRLQGILADVMVDADGTPSSSHASAQIIDAEVVEDDEADEEEDEE